MIAQLLYQNSETGAIHDITTLVTDASWKTTRKGSPGALDFTILDVEDVQIVHGGKVSLKVDGKGLFYGYVFKHSKGDSGEIKVTAYDQLRYLKNKYTYVMVGKRADQIVKQIAGDFKLKLGSLADTKYVIPSVVEDSKTLFDIILNALDLTLVHGKEMYYLWDDYGQLRLSNVRESHLDLIVGDGSLATSYDYTSSIDSDTANMIKLVRDNKETSKRDVYVVKDSNSMGRWGILQHYDKVGEGLNRAQIENQASNLLELKNRPTRDLSMDAISNLHVRAGRSLFVKLKDVDMSGWYIVDECSHNLMKETMSLKLVVM